MYLSLILGFKIAHFQQCSEKMCRFNFAISYEICDKPGHGKVNNAIIFWMRDIVQIFRNIVCSDKARINVCTL